MCRTVSEPAISRRALLRTVLRLGSLTAAAPLLQACERVAATTPTKVSGVSLPSTPSPTGIPSPTARPSQTSTLSPTLIASSTAPLDPTVPPSLTATPKATAMPKPTATLGSAPIVEADEADVVRVAFVKTSNRAEGVRRALDLLGLNPVQGKRVLLKPNFNSADPAPGSTHPDTLRTLTEELWTMGARSITVGDRSGMGRTRSVMETLGVMEMAEELEFETLVFDEMYEKTDWELIRPYDSHWQQGFPLARPCLEAEAVVQTCCLKTHQFGGHFTMSLKNSVGLVGRDMPGMSALFMEELHRSQHQRAMIAEINTAYSPALIVLDGVEAFTTGGPATGRKVSTEIVLAGTDRIAIDAVGVAFLRHFQTTPQVAHGPIFQQEQIARAVELGLGVDGPGKIRLVTGDPDSESYAARIREVLLADGT